MPLCLPVRPPKRPTSQDAPEKRAKDCPPQKISRLRIKRRGWSSNSISMEKSCDGRSFNSRLSGMKSPRTALSILLLSEILKTYGPMSSSLPPTSPFPLPKSSTSIPADGLSRLSSVNQSNIWEYRTLRQESNRQYSELLRSASG